ncbi:MULTISPECIES: ketopantoate reductase family protein [unclassified Cryobacterium]|uniref:ketopantoate reductase family protein n=1 Tax=unclassified Cryobacterium TaxID=2649013 RepID=UPI00106D7DFA|nr:MULTISPECIES: 2-dehydropantoate 2-reductase N-terminal domain-containing protein [unclassified Cryobacterium]TFC53382.1 ketopantoate reductase family protein [Cryobacterium sp. TMB3-1-2]TFC72647.1 ketopantoate reductase family protein [Cryobacterium sp. TMB3-15]TFC76153.1 ketopantoate reductase family protein [Cryobacterium sp. TMB3-10]TFD40616.1 ketopantoate reductase family protein [Cryobacterium sp. TMB3-12]
MSQVTMSEPVIAVVGAGAVGGLLAALLDRAGVEVVAVARPQTARAIAAEGLTIHSPHFGDGVSRITAVTEIPDGANVILATKAFALPAVTDSLAQARPTEVVSLLNGIEHLAILRDHAPGALVAGASVAVESTRLSPTVIEHRSPFLRLTVPATAADSGITAAWRKAGLDVTVAGTDQEVLWAKFRFLAPMALLTSYWRLPIGAALERDAALTTAVLTDVARVASLDGVPTDAGQLATALAALPASMRSSLQNDLEAGQRSELDAIGGALARRGRSLGADTAAVDGLLADLTAR